MFNAYLSRIISRNSQYLLFKKQIRKATLVGSIALNYYCPIQAIFPEVLKKISKKGYNITIYNLNENTVINFSWKEGKKKNGTIVVINSETILNNLEYCKEMLSDSDSDSEDNN